MIASESAAPAAELDALHRPRAAPSETADAMPLTSKLLQ
jgi:hypothetical protein